MPTSIVEGTVEETSLRWSRRGISLFNSIRFRKDDGTEQTVNKAVVKQEVADQLTPGARGRFYLFKAFDIGGIHGVRLPDGREIYAFPANNEKIFLISGSVALLWVVLAIFTRGGVPVLGAGLLILSGFGYYFMSKGRHEAKAQFEGDG